jgi:hypothetical protein
MQMDLNHFSAFISDTSYYLKNCFCYPFIWGCKSKSRFVSLQNFIAKILNYFLRNLPELLEKTTWFLNGLQR